MKARLHLIDLFRLPILYSIVWFHSYSFLFSQEYNPNEWSETISRVLLIGMKMFAYGGQWIFSISCFLIGYRNIKKNQTLRYLGLFFVGILVLMLGQSDPFLQNIQFEWDIYHFLFVNLIFIYLLQRYAISGKAITLFGALLLMIPFWNFHTFFADHSLLKKILIGDFTGTGEGGWALLPWSGLTFLFFGLGQLNRENKINWSNSPSKISMIFYIVSIAVFSTSVFYFYQTPIGPSYYTYLFQPPLWVLIGINGLMIVALRLAVIAKWNERLSGYKWIQYISSLAWNQNLALTYLVQLVLLFCISWTVELTIQTIDVIAVLGFFATELVARKVVKLRISRHPITSS